MNEKMLEKTANQYNTPAYIFDTDLLKDRINLLKSKLGNRVEICYAMKANPFLVNALNSEVEKFEVCSPGEFRICERNGIDMKKVVLSGVYKNPEDIAYVTEKYGCEITYTVESLNQIKLLLSCAKKVEKKLPLLIRISSGNQFGIDKKTLEEIITSSEYTDFLDIKGLQLYSGTQKKKMKQIEGELKDLEDYSLYLKDTYNFHVEEIEYGPGLYVSYFDNEEDQDEKILSEFAEVMTRVGFEGKITFEMGRFIASPCGLYLTSVVDLKETDGKKYCIVDGGINHVNYYGQTMAMRTPWITQLPKKEGSIDKWNICGSLCTVGDLLVKQFPLNDAKLGDILVFDKIGAYSITEGIYLFLSRDLPNVYLYSETKGLELVRTSAPTDTINSIK